MEFKPLHYVGEKIEVEYDRPPAYLKTPSCPDRIQWRGDSYRIKQRLAEWHDFQRRGRMARNMSTEHASRAETRGSWGVGRFYFRVLTACGRVFEIYYDRAPKDVDDRLGSWFLDRELEQTDQA